MSPALEDHEILVNMERAGHLREGRRALLGMVGGVQLVDPVLEHVDEGTLAAKAAAPRLKVGSARVLYDVDAVPVKLGVEKVEADGDVLRPLAAVVEDDVDRPEPSTTPWRKTRSPWSPIRTAICAASKLRHRGSMSIPAICA